MNDIAIITLVALSALLIGGGAGYWFADRRARAQAAKTEDVRQRFDDYRRQVTEHFGRTAEHFQAIGEQYRELYEHMASGAESLFDAPAPGSRLENAARVALGDPADTPVTDRTASDAADTGDEAGTDAAKQDADGKEARPAQDTATDDEDQDPAVERADDADTAASPETGADETPRTYH
jgi:uncharacterized membrane-anchored protein YhcB (DUF1043 family)